MPKVSRTKKTTTPVKEIKQQDVARLLIDSIDLCKTQLIADVLAYCNLNKEEKNKLAKISNATTVKLKDAVLAQLVRLY